MNRLTHERWFAAGIRLLMLFAVWIGASSAWAQETEVSEPVSAELITGLIERIQSSSSMNPAEKDTLLEFYQQALSHVRARDEWEVKTQEFDVARETAPQQVADAERELMSPLSVPDPDEFADATAEALNARLAESERTHTQLREEIAEREREPGRRGERRRQIPELQRTARQRLDEATAAAGAPPAAGESAELTQARRVTSRARTQALEAELRSYDAELNSYDARNQLMTLRLDVANRRMTETERLVNLLRDLVAVKQQEEANQAARAAREQLLEASNAPPNVRALVQELAAENALLVSERSGPNARSGLVEKLRRASEEFDEISEQLASVEANFEWSRARIDVAQRTELMGLLLQNQLAELPNDGDLRREVRARTQAIGAAQLRQLEISQRRRELSDVEALVEDRLTELAPDAVDDERDAMAEALRQVYWSNRRALDSLMTDYDTYLTRLFEVNAKQEQLIEKAAEFRLFIGENILWVRSGTPINRTTLRNFLPSFAALFNFRDLLAIPTAFWSDIRSFPLMYVVGAILCCALIAARGFFRSHLVSVGMEASRPSQTSQSLTFYGLIYTVVYSISIPLPILLLTYRATTPYVAISVSADALCTGLLWGALGWAVLECIRVSLMPQGLALSHLKWRDEDCRVSRRMLKIFMAVSLPLIALIVAFDKYPDVRYAQSAGRFAFLGLMLLILIQSHVLFRPGESAVLRIFRTLWDSPLLRRERFWYSVVLLTPFLMGAAAGIGYYYSALQLYWKVADTLIVLYGILIAGGIAMRWTLLERRRITVEQWKKKFSGADGEAETGPEMDMVRVDTQVTRMLRFVFLFSIVGVVYAIWSDVLPALGILERFSLWSISETVNVSQVDASGVTAMGSEVRIVDITLRHVVISLFILGGTVIAARDLPGFLELAVLQRTRLGTGERYAITSVVSYVLVVVGLILALNELGFGWGRMQWLVAALGLGLGFGLQEIVANFISGLILLFERPIRVGDVVTIGEVSGRVSRINIRATWIKSFDRRDLVVPNKEFVTGRLVNWTLSDTVLRVEVPVGIAYGSDVRLAKKTMLECARAHPMVMKDPPPEVFFLNFGDSNLALELRVFSPDVESTLTIRDDLHLAIDDAFREAKIDISYPQRDVHLRSIGAPIRVIREDAPEADAEAH